MPVRLHDHGLVSCLILKWLETFGVVARGRQVIDPENQPGAQRHGEVHTIRNNAVAVEHAAYIDGAELGKKIDEIVTVHRSPAF
ncbi:hypothetical protein ASC80_07670 [Afipia sp. Root123D2]|nr:hypothetical protein ASC80_07670 [Afipia sp. Root123D2]